MYTPRASSRKSRNNFDDARSTKSMRNEFEKPDTPLKARAPDMVRPSLPSQNLTPMANQSSSSAAATSAQQGKSHKFVFPVGNNPESPPIVTEAKTVSDFNAPVARDSNWPESIVESETTIRAETNHNFTEETLKENGLKLQKQSKSFSNFSDHQNSAHKKLQIRLMPTE